MEMEDDMEVGLVQQFSCLGTTDKEVLIAQLQKLVGPQLNTSAAQFFLDMNNWNLQLAIGAYFDLTEDASSSTAQHYSSQQVNGAVSISQSTWNGPEENWEDDDTKPVEQNAGAWRFDGSPSPTSAKYSNYSMTIIQDMSMSEDTLIPPRSKFIKRWKIKNDGNIPWPNGAHLQITSGNRSLVVGGGERILMNPPQVQPDECREIIVECISPDNPGNYQTSWRMSTPEGILFGEEIWVICSVGADLTVDLTQQLQTLSCDNNSRVNYPIVQMIHSAPPDVSSHPIIATTTAVMPMPIHTNAAGEAQSGTTVGNSFFPHQFQDSSSDMS